MTEICKICKQESTPWQYIKELDGHICDTCSYFLTDIRSLINKPYPAISILKYIKGHIKND